MPLTVCHVAAALPFRRRKLLFGPLVAGTIAPDLPKFLLLNPGNGSSHAWAEAFGVGVPAGLCLLWLFHHFLKHALLAIAPPRLHALGRGSRTETGLSRHAEFVCTLIGLSLGILTHVFFDSLTHQGTWFTRAFPAMAAPCPFDASRLLLAPMAWVDVLQYALTILGLVALFVSLRRSLTRRVPDFHAAAPYFSRRVRIILICTSATISIGCGVARMSVHRIFYWHVTPASGFGSLVITALSAQFGQLLILGMFLRFTFQTNSAASVQPERDWVPN